MVEVVQLKAEARADNGRGASRALRRKGMVPAVIYGGNKGNEYVAVDERFVRKQYERGGFSNRVVELQTNGASVRVLPRDVQLHPVSDKPIHVDFQRLVPGEKIRIAVPVTFVGEGDAPGLKRGGIVNVVRHEIDLICDVDSIPDRIVVNLAGLDINDSLHISQVELPKGVSPALKRDFTVASITALLSSNLKMASLPRCPLMMRKSLTMPANNCGSRLSIKSSILRLANKRTSRSTASNKWPDK